MRSGPLVFAAAFALFFLAGCVSEDRPVSYRKCVTCHGEPGGGGTMAAPDLAGMELDFGQFKKQLLKGSDWEGKPPKKWKYRWKKMPPQVGLSEEQIRALFEYIKSAD